MELDQELLNDFLDESFELLDECKTSLEKFATSGHASCFENFGLMIDRIMGASYTMELKYIGDLSKLGKQLGYKSSQISDMEKLMTIQSLLSQLIKELDSNFKNLRKFGPSSEEPIQTDLVSKLEKANEDLGDLRASVKM